MARKPVDPNPEFNQIYLCIKIINDIFRGE